MRRPFDHQNKSKIENVDNRQSGHRLDAMHIKGEKFTEHHDNDFQEWEQYDIIHVEYPRDSSTIANQYVPNYIQDDVIESNSYQAISYRYISEIKSGIKLGRKISDNDEKWGEKWFEIRCKEATVKDKKVVDVIIKLFSKFWTKFDKIEGECCHQVLINGSKKYMHDGLIYELKDFYTVDNITVRKNKRPLPAYQPSNQNVSLAGLDFGGPQIEQDITPPMKEPVYDPR